MATSIFFNGRLISTPGSYSEVDASALETIGLGASGVVAVIGTAVGGRPVTEIEDLDDFITITKPEQSNSTFKSGDLREAIPILFNPSNDPNILGGAQSVVAMKVNPATASSATLENAYNNIITLTSADYGAFTDQINVTVGSGTTQGKLLTITYEDTVETVDDLGGDSMFSLSYVKPTNGWDTITAEVEAGGAIVCDATRDLGGLDSEMTQLGGNDTLLVSSASGSDTTQQIIVYGLDASAAYQVETLNLNGSSSVAGTLTFSKVLGARIVGTTAGVVTLTDTTPTTVLTIAAGANGDAGLALAASNYVGNTTITLVSDGASTKDVLLIGKSTSGVTQYEKITLTGTTPITGSGNFSEINYWALGDVESAQTLTASTEAARTVPSVQTTLTKCADYFNSKYESSAGFVFTLNTSLTTLDPANLDVTTGGVGAQSCLSPADPDFYADAYLTVTWINSNSQLVTAAKVASAIGGSPSNTTSPVYLTGGTEGTATSTEWQLALNLLKQVLVNSVVVLTGDPSIHASLAAHIAYMCGAGRKERDGFVGLLNTALTDVPTKTEAKAQIVNLNTRHIRAFAQAIDKYNTDGEREEFMPYYTACVAAGMQAGSVVGTSLTYKYANVLNFRQSSTWNPIDDTEEMIQAGLCFLENVPGTGRRFVRNITTHLSSNNLAYIEGSVNEAVNYSVYNFRTEMEAAVGQRGFSGTVNASLGIARAILEILIGENIIVAARSLNIELLTDVMEVSVEIAPVIPVNFVKNVIHLITVPQTA